MYPLYRRLGGPESRSERYAEAEEEKTWKKTEGTFVNIVFDTYA
jgi:hypothetical protein